jgi:hypothetical protein
MEDDLYTPLPADGNPIRLLKIAPGAFSDPISCTLTSFDLNDTLDYEALSYIWGLDLKTKLITLNGHTVHIRANLFQALSHIRLPDQDRLIWVDALSIRQDSIVEKNQQVLKIDQIFQRASRVLAWLGTGDDQTVALKKYIQHHKPRKMSKDDLILACEAVISVLNRPYWERTWIVQEFILARRIMFYCGSMVVDLDDFALFYDKLELYAIYRSTPELWNNTTESTSGTFGLDTSPLTHSTEELDRRLKDFASQLRQSAYSLLMDRRRLGYMDHSKHLWSIILSHSKTRCEDPRDKIFAVQALLDPKLDERVRVDYAMSAEDLLFCALQKWGSHSQPWIFDRTRESLGLSWMDLLQKVTSSGLLHPHSGIEYDFQLQVRVGKVTFVNGLQIHQSWTKFFGVYTGDVGIGMLTNMFYISQISPKSGDPIVHFEHTGVAFVFVENDQGVRTPFTAVLIHPNERKITPSLKFHPSVELFQKSHFSNVIFDLPGKSCKRLSPFQLVTIGSCIQAEITDNLYKDRHSAIGKQWLQSQNRASIQYKVALDDREELKEEHRAAMSRLKELR